MKWLKDQLDVLTDMGVDGFKLDAGDPCYYHAGDKLFRDVSTDELSRLWAEFGEQKMLIPSLPELQRIRSNKRTDPQHHRKSHLMQFFEHRLRILEIIPPELPPSIIRRPAIIDHQNT